MLSGLPFVLQTSRETIKNMEAKKMNKRNEKMPYRFGLDEPRQFTEAIPEPGDPEVSLMDFIDPEQPHFHEKLSDGTEILYEFGNEPMIYLQVNGRIGFAPLDWYRANKRGIWKRYFEVRPVTLTKT